MYSYFKTRTFDVILLCVGPNFYTYAFYSQSSFTLTLSYTNEFAIKSYNMICCTSPFYFNNFQEIPNSPYFCVFKFSFHLSLLHRRTRSVFELKTYSAVSKCDFSRHSAVSRLPLNDRCGNPKR